MMTMAILFSVTLYSRGDMLAHGKITKKYQIEANDDVGAVMSAKEKAKNEFPDRREAPWYADSVVENRRRLA